MNTRQRYEEVPSLERSDLISAITTRVDLRVRRSETILKADCEMADPWEELVYD